MLDRHKVQIIGNPFATLQLPGNQQHIVTTYYPEHEITVVNVNVDIVTLGITLSVLKEQFEKYLETLPEDLANEIKETTRKAVYGR